MAKFQVHKYNRAYLVPLGMHSYNVTQPTIELFKKAYTYYFAIVSLFSTSSTILFAIRHSDEPKDALEAFKICAGTFQSAICFFSFGLQMKKVKVLHCRFQEIVDTGIPFTSIYAHSIQKIAISREFPTSRKMDTMIRLCLRSKNNLKTHQLAVESSLLFRPKFRYFSF